MPRTLLAPLLAVALIFSVPVSAADTEGGKADSAATSSDGEKTNDATMTEGETNHAETTGDEGKTNFAETNFRLILPGSWRELHSSDEGFWSYRRADDKAQVSVTLGFAPEPVPREEVPGMFESFAENRRQALQEQVPGCELSQLVPKEHLEAVTGAYVARCASATKYKGEFLIARTDMVASVLLETHELSEEVFLELFSEVRAGTALAGAN